MSNASRLQQRRLNILFEKLGRLQFAYMESLTTGKATEVQLKDKLEAITAHYVLIKREKGEPLIAADPIIA